jgi:hypothetical protein
VGSPNDFSETAALSVEALRVLVSEGDAQQRVWASWRLALILGTEGLPQLRQHLDGDPDVGTRRNQLIVVAGLGERTLLHVFAEHEPDPLLRGEAVVLVWRTARDLDEVCPLLRRRLAKERDAGVLARLIGVSPPLPAETFFSELRAIACRGPSQECRRLAWERTMSAASWTKCPDWRPALDEPDDRLRADLLARWAGSDQHPTLLATAGGSPRERMILEALVEHERKYTWQALETIASATAHVDLVAALLRGPYPEPARWWCLAQLGLESIDSDSYVYTWDHLERAYAEVDKADLSSREIEAVRQAEQWIRDHHGGDLDLAIQDDSYDPCEDQRRFLRLIGYEPR